MENFKKQLHMRKLLPLRLLNGLKADLAGLFSIISNDVLILIVDKRSQYLN